MKYIKNLFNQDDEIEKLEFEDALNRLKRYTKRHKKNLCKVFVCFFMTVLTLISGAKLFTKTNFFITGTNKLFASLGITNEEVKTVTFSSDDKNDSRSWEIIESAEWISQNKAKLTFELSSTLKTDDSNDKNVIFVVDTSSSMSGAKLENVKTEIIEAINYISSNSNNIKLNIAIISFNSTSKIDSNFTSNINEVTNIIQNLSASGSTNYNAAYKKIDEVMDTYEKNASTDTIAMLITDGYPTDENPNQIATYEILKEKYPYLNIYGIQSEIGINILDEIKEISDYQYMIEPNSKTTLENIFIKTILNPKKYETFKIIDYIDQNYFHLKSNEDINVSTGIITLEEENNLQKITWDLEKNKYQSGTKATMTIEVDQKEEYQQIIDNYPINKKTTVIENFSSENPNEKTTTKTTVLKNGHQVIYDTNTPKNCKLEEEKLETYYVFDIVKKSPKKLSCNGYIFKGWQIIEDDITKVNDDVFIMPNHDVTIRATWTKQAINMTMEGTVNEKTTLYKIIENEAKTNGLAKEYTGKHQDTLDNVGDEKIYYYYAEDETASSEVANKNNVIFAGVCWKMYRTTDSGGVKLLYNGEPDENRSCLDTRENHVGYASKTTLMLNRNYYYGTNYTYDKTTKKFSLTGEKEQQTWSDTTYQNILGKYTCRSTSANTTCTTLYYVDSYASSVSANIYQINSNVNFRTIGNSAFNAQSKSISDVGYMQNARQDSKEINFSYEEQLLSSESTTEINDYYYSEEIEWSHLETNEYNLKEPKLISTINDTSELVGKYTSLSKNENETSQTIYYIVGTSSSKIHYIEISNDPNIVIDNYNTTYYFGDNIEQNSDGTYTITNPIEVKRFELLSKYKDLRSSTNKKKYTCNNLGAVCNYPSYIIDVSQDSYTYTNKKDETLVASSYTYNPDPDNNPNTDDGIYTLSGEIENTWPWNENSTTADTKPYTCWNTTSTCSSISYVIKADTKTATYITMENGNGINETLDELLYNQNVNKYDSAIKRLIDIWYEKNLLDYTKYIEDVIYCNDRKIYSMDGYMLSSGNFLNYSIYFETGNQANNSLTCSNKTDMFSVSNDLAKLKYPIALPSAIEIAHMGDITAIQGDKQFLLLTPAQYNGTSYNRHTITPSGYPSGIFSVSTSRQVRPTISLIPDTTYYDGDGSMEHPYIVDIDLNK